MFSSFKALSSGIISLSFRRFVFPIPYFLLSDSERFLYSEFNDVSHFMMVIIKRVFLCFLTLIKKLTV